MHIGADKPSQGTTSQSAHHISNRSHGGLSNFMLQKIQSDHQISRDSLYLGKNRSVATIRPCTFIPHF